MTESAVLLGTAVFVIVAAPVLLTRGGWWVDHPRLALSAWLLSLAVGAIALIASVVLWFFPTPVWQQTGCTGCGAVAAFVAGIIGFGGLTALLASTVAHGERLVRSEQRTGIAMLRLCAGARRIEPHQDGTPVSVVDDHGAYACSSRACGSQILVSTGLHGELTGAELASVVEHERAHLRGRHEWLLRVARLNAAVFSWLPAARSLERYVHLVVELIADDHAERACGTWATLGALQTLARLGDDPAARLRAHRLSDRSDAQPYGCLGVSISTTSSARS